MRHTVTSFVILLMFISSASALVFDFDYPAQVQINESFSVSLSAETTNTYDVKIFISNNDDKIISQIYNEGWKNPYYYVKAVFPEKSEFDVRVINYSSEATICARLRKTDSSSFSEECGSIEIAEEAEEPEEQSGPEENNTPSEQEAKPDFVSSHSGSTETLEQSEDKGAEEPERIHLNPQARRSSDKFITKDEKLRLFALYAFTGLVVLIVIFLIFKKL